MRINKNSVFKLKIIRIDFYRDCSTAGVLVQIDHEGGFTETVEYLIHGHNSANKRMDVTLDPDVYIHRERNPEREFGFYINRPFSLSFRAKSKLYKIVEVCEVQVELGAGIMVGDA